MLRQYLCQRLKGQQEHPLVFVGGNARAGTQPEHQVFTGPLPQGDVLNVLHDLAAIPDALDVSLQVPGQGEPLTRKVGAGAGAEAQIFPAGPVFHVVAGVQALTGKVGDLILPVAPGAEHLHSSKVHICLEVVSGQVGGILVFVQRRTFFHFQAVAADVFRQQLQHIVQGLLPVCQGLARQAVHQIHADIAVARLADPLVCSDRLGIGMGTAQFFEDLIIVALDSQAHPVEALGTKPVEELFTDGVGIGLKGDLSVVVHVKVPANGGQDDRHTLRTEEAGGAAAKVNGVHLVVGGQGAGLLDVSTDRVQIAVHQLVILAGQGVKVAVLTLAAAEGHMDIQAQRSLVLSFC